MTLDRIIHETKDRPNNGLSDNNRRLLTTAFNGDFSAEYASYIDLEKNANIKNGKIEIIDGTSLGNKQLIYLLKGSATFRITDFSIFEDPNVYMLSEGDRIIVPERALYELHAEPGSKIFTFNEKLSNYSPYNWDNILPEGFNAKQAKFAFLKDDFPLGGHYHKYNEFFFLINGEGNFYFKDTKTPDALQELHLLAPESKLFVPAFVGHKAFLKKDSLLVGFTEEPYISPEHNDHKIEGDSFYNLPTGK
ncbi:MAG TPA: hypothetical protein VEC16_03585 [Alphaproteobacteria bacterium]|nr:hypothetical protein [Alphaproteobacteria bacterium]